MRLKTGDENYYAPLEKIAPKSLGKSIEGTISRPFKVLFQVPGQRVEMAHHAVHGLHHSDIRLEECTWPESAGKG